MPELPEVETVVRDLRPLLIGRTIRAVSVGKLKLRKPWWKAGEKSHLIGQQITTIHRRGKHIAIDLKGGGCLLVHLGMTGQFTVKAPSVPTETHTHFVFELDDGQQLRFRDIRRFGSVELFATRQEVTELLNSLLGPEPENLEAEYFREAVNSSERTLKAILLDQSVVAGVGNIYADESLFRAKLHPELRGSAVTPQACERLRLAIQEVITSAIENRGSTIRDYVGGSGLRGGYQDEFTVYGRTGEPCSRCKTPIERIRVAGRSSHFCAKCQPAKSTSISSRKTGNTQGE